MSEQTTIPKIETPQQVHVPPSAELEEEAVRRLIKETVWPPPHQLQFPKD